MSVRLQVFYDLAKNQTKNVRYAESHHHSVKNKKFNLKLAFYCLVKVFKVKIQLLNVFS